MQNNIFPFQLLIYDVESLSCYIYQFLNYVKVTFISLYKHSFFFSIIEDTAGDFWCKLELKTTVFVPTDISGLTLKGPRKKCI